jgi:hypothetical protein
MRFSSQRAASPRLAAIAPWITVREATGRAHKPTADGASLSHVRCDQPPEPSLGADAVAEVSR